ncbi:unnamed protein product [Notodromas monacha]|uniref:Ionotropic glutamate receptor C-terminal domain-containing protein n=1 Tax=Notodromas monacha TaxID=399045 RepID=A0A7R9BW34_9CRUS|nr:unnamed protein product [Notodromas monacha]CAG0922470.1 unnamed protein product [Notodromas monacha]
MLVPRQSSAVWQTIVAHVGLGIGKANKDCPDDGWLLDQPAFADLRVHDHPWFARLLAADWGGGEAPKNLSGRLVAATWWLFGFIIIASYTANLAAFLTVSRLDTPIESLDDLSKQYKVRYAPMNGSSSMTYFERMAYIESKFYE